MTTAKAFPLATVLSITTGRLLCPIAEVYVVLNHLTGDDVYTHQIPRVLEECAPWLLHSFPALRTVDLTTLDAILAQTPGFPGVARWLATLDLPSTYRLTPMPQDKHTRKDPVAELAA